MYIIYLSATEASLPPVYTCCTMNFFHITLQRTGQVVNDDSSFNVCVRERKRVCVLEGLLVTGARVSGADANE